MKKDKIIISCSFLGEPFTGTPRMAIELCKEIKKKYSKYTLFVSPPYIHPDNYQHYNDLAPVKIGKIKQYYIWEQIDLPIWINSNFPNNWLLNLHPVIPLIRSIKSIPFVHDLIYKKIPGEFRKRYRYVYGFLSDISIKTSQIIFVPSEFTKRDLMNTFGLSENRIVVIKEGISSFFSYDKDVKKENFILGVSSVTKRKNWIRLVKAFAILRKDYPDIKLYIIGGIQNSMSQQEIDEIIKQEGVVYLGKVEDDILRDYYRKAKLFVHVSLFEGFGLTPLEAMACGTPVVVSNTTSLPEVVGNAGLYVNPLDVEDIYEKMKILIENQKLQRDLIDKGFVQVAKFSWTSMAESVFETLEKLLAQEQG